MPQIVLPAMGCQRTTLFEYIARGILPYHAGPFAGSVEQHQVVWSPIGKGRAEGVAEPSRALVSVYFVQALF